MLRFAAIVAAVGIAGFVFSSLIGTNVVSNIIFGVAAVCLVAGPLVFLATVVIGLFLEFVGINRKYEAKFVTRGAVADASAAPPWQPEALPEGLRRERKGPLNPSTGRARTT